VSLGARPSIGWTGDDRWFDALGWVAAAWQTCVGRVSAGIWACAMTTSHDTRFHYRPSATASSNRMTFLRTLLIGICFFDW